MEKCEENQDNGMMNDSELNNLTELFKILGDPTRVKILYYFFQEEICVSDLATKLNMTESAVSRHLRILKANGIIKKRREGKLVFYSLADDYICSIIKAGRKYITENESRLLSE